MIYLHFFSFRYIAVPVIVSMSDDYQSYFQIGLYSAIPPVLMTIVVISGGILFDKLLSNDIIGRTLGRKMAQTLGNSFCYNLYVVQYFETKR